MFRKAFYSSMPFSIFFFSVVLAFYGCSSVATVNQIQTSTTYPNKLKIKALVYVPDDITNKIVPVRSSTDVCNMYNGEVNVGSAYFSAIESGLKSSLEVVEFVKSQPTPELIKMRGFDIGVSVNLQNENFSLTPSQVLGFFGNSIRQNAQYQVSFGLTFFDDSGSLIYSMTANGSSFDTKDLGCSKIAEMMAGTIEKGLKQLADNISQLCYGNSDLKEYAKTRKK